MLHNVPAVITSYRPEILLLSSHLYIKNINVNVYKRVNELGRYK